MVVLERRVKSFEDMWTEDKARLRRFSPDVGVTWGSPLPTQSDGLAVYTERGERWQSPESPFELNPDALPPIVDGLVADIEGMWGTSFVERPDIEVLANDRYLPRINELQRETNEALGCGSVANSPPTMSHFAHQGVIVIPKSYLVRTPRGRSLSVASSDFDVMALQWDKPFFEGALYEELTHALFRQLRGEWKEEYVSVVRETRAGQMRRTSMLNEAMAQYAKERQVEEGRGSWGFYVAADKIGVVWGDASTREYYRMVDALASTHSLVQIAMIDGITIQEEEGRVHAHFNNFHPHHERKQAVFAGS